MDDHSVSRETSARLQTFVDLLLKWTAKINLIAPNTMDAAWDRHIADSAQLLPLAPKSARHWVDLGSGGGLPGMVCAIMAQDYGLECGFTFVESDQRKAAFLRTALRTCDVEADVVASRIERAPPLAGDVVSARALAPLPRLLPLVSRHLANDGIALLPKGAKAPAELSAARQDWRFDLEEKPSKTDPNSQILMLRTIARVNDGSAPRR